MNKFFDHLNKCGLIHVEQAWEGFEIVLGWESRNKYRILDENMRPLAFAAEQSTGFGGAALRQVLGHLRSFIVSIFDENRQNIYELAFAFRWFFKTLILRDAQGEII